MGMYLRDLEVEGIEVPVEESLLEKVERPEKLTEGDISRELAREERRQEELYREGLFETSLRAIEAEPEEPLKMLFEEFAKPEGIEEPIEESLEGVVKYEELVEELDIPWEGFEELIEEAEGSKGELMEVKPLEEVIEERAEELVKEEAAGKIEEAKEETLEEIEEHLSMEVEKSFEEVIEEGVEEGVSQEVREEVREEGRVEEDQEETGGVREEEKAEKAVEEEVEAAEGGGPPEGPSEAVAAGEERPEKEFETIIPESGQITYHEHHGMFEKGLYFVKATGEDKKVFEWSTQKEETNDELRISVPKRLKDELIGRKVKIAIFRYDHSLHFKSKGPNFHFSPKDGLKVEGREIEIEKVEPWSWGTKHGAFMKVKLKERSIEGAEIYLVFHEDGSLSILLAKSKRPVTLRTKGNFLIIEYYNTKAIIPIITQEWKIGKEYYLNIPVEGRVELGLLQESRKIFGYHNTEELRKKIKEGGLILVAHFDNKRDVFCRNERLVIGVPEGAGVLEYIETLPSPEFWEELSEEDVERIKEASKIMVGECGWDRAKKFVEDGGIAELRELKFIGREVKIIETNERIDSVYLTQDNKLVVIESKASRTSEGRLAEHVRGGLERLKEYREHIQEYGLDLTKQGLGIEKGENIKAYMIVYTYFDLENREVKVGYVWLPEG